MEVNEPYVDVLIVNYNSFKETIELYNQLQGINYKNYFIRIIDNNSTDNSKKILKRYIPNQNLFLNKENLGYAAGNNIGIQKAIDGNSDYVWILNPDIRVEKDTLKILIEHIEKDKKIAAVGPRICERSNKEIIYSDGGFINIENGFQTGHLNTKKNIADIAENVESKEIDYVNGSCFLINLACLEYIGFLREDFFLYFEETEWCLRAKKLEWKLMAVYQTACFHLSSKKEFRYFYYMTRNRVYLSILLKKHIAKTIKFEIRTIGSFILNLHLKVAFYKVCGLVGVLFKIPLKDYFHIFL